ncbi:MAG: histidinol phosphate phosphatase domain-containing protein [Deltaproteobacteria bacterium]|nr:histidinol phosphate phosphatase domain-containing protein [Deltaproteobacteria bacterium]
MIDLHTHTLLSDGVLVPSELIRRARVIGYAAIAITDHADESNIESVLEQIRKVTVLYNSAASFKAVPGVELTHIPPCRIPSMVERARSLGARIVVGHGETLSEPVERGTNMAFIKARVDTLAHPGLVTAAHCREAAKKRVFLEITSRHGHASSNGHVAAMAIRHGAPLVINSDAHGPGDLISANAAINVALGAGLSIKDFRRMQKNAEAIVKKALS